MVCLTLLRFDIYIFWCCKCVPFFDITYFAFIFLAPEITTTDGMSNVNIVSRLYLFWRYNFFSAFFDITYFHFIFLGPEITTTDGMSYVNIVSRLYLFGGIIFFRFF